MRACKQHIFLPMLHCVSIKTPDFDRNLVYVINKSINQSFILPEKFVTIKASKTKHMRTGQQGKTLTAALL